MCFEADEAYEYSEDSAQCLNAHAVNFAVHGVSTAPMSRSFGTGRLDNASALGAGIDSLQPWLDTAEVEPMTAWQFRYL